MINEKIDIVIPERREDIGPRSDMVQVGPDGMIYECPLPLEGTVHREGSTIEDLRFLKCSDCGYQITVYPRIPVAEMGRLWFALKGVCLDCLVASAPKTMAEVDIT